MVATVDDGDGTALFAEIHLAIFALHIEIAVDEHCPLTKGAPEWLLSVEIEIAMAVNGRTIERIIGTFEMTVLIIGLVGAIQRVQVEAADETYPLGDKTLAVNVPHMGLGNGITAFGPIEGGVQRIDEIDITVIAHGDVLDTEGVAPEVEHSEIADSSLRLSTLGSEYDIVRFFAHSNDG